MAIYFGIMFDIHSAGIHVIFPTYFTFTGQYRWGGVRHSIWRVGFLWSGGPLVFSRPPGLELL